MNQRDSDRQLAVLKALGDETRYAMYEELARSTAALSASDLAERLGIHPNTVRLHLERLREVGLVDVEAVHRGTVGRPQHLYFLSAGAPGLGFDPPAHALLAGLLAALAERVGADADEAAETGRVWGSDAGRRTRAAQLPRRARVGARPSSASSRRWSRRRRRPDAARIEFLHCPFRELAEAYPELVCNLHRGLCEGVVDAVGGGTVEEFATLYDAEPCHVTVGVGYPDTTVPSSTSSSEVRCSPSRTPAPSSPSPTPPRQGEEPDRGRRQPRARAAGRRPPRWLLRPELRDVLRHRRRRRRHQASEHGGVTVVIDPASAPHLGGASLDFKDGLQGAGFASTTRTRSAAAAAARASASRLALRRSLACPTVSVLPDELVEQRLHLVAAERAVDARLDGAGAVDAEQPRLARRCATRRRSARARCRSVPW